MTYKKFKLITDYYHKVKTANKELTKKEATAARLVGAVVNVINKK